jgi:hypothetical protein
MTSPPSYPEQHKACRAKSPQKRLLVDLCCWPAGFAAAD